MKKQSNSFFVENFLLKIFHKTLNRILSFKDLHKGEECYIFGDGISLKWFELDSFSDKPAIALNKILFHNDVNYLNLKYNLFIEPYYFYPYFWDRDDATVKITGERYFRNNVQVKFRETIKKYNDISFFINLSNYPVLWDSNIYYLYKGINDKNFDFLNECNINRENIYDGSLKFAISLAIFMGFKSIYLVGCDYTHQNSMSLHWYEKGKGKLKPQPKYYKNFFNIASNYSKIYTITLEGKGCILPSLTYTSFTGKKPNFRENYDLMNKAMLDILANDPWYKGRIF